MDHLEGVMTVTTLDCASCAAALDHCHGTLLTHADGFVECTEDGCFDLDRVRHTLIIECHEVLGGCECLAVLETEVLLRAS